MGTRRRRYNDEEKARYINRLLQGESLQEIANKEGINPVLNVVLPVVNTFNKRLQVVLS